MVVVQAEHGGVAPGLHQTRTAKLELAHDAQPCRRQHLSIGVGLGFGVATILNPRVARVSPPWATDRIWLRCIAHLRS
jgi:hypothetical protein